MIATFALCGVSMAAKAVDFREKQKEALSKFKEALKDVLQPCHDDYYLMRWIMANYTTDFDLRTSERDLRTHLQWRVQVGADSVLQWTAPESLRRFYPGGLYGHDKFGRPIWIEPLGFADVRGLLRSAKKSDIVRLKIQHCELIQNKIHEQRQKMGDQVDGLIILCDLEHVGLHHIWKPGMDVYNEVLAIFERNYPETVRQTYVINAPRIFPIIYNIAKPFLSEATKRKIVILGKNWKPALLEVIDADQLPVHWGGTATDADGDPYCRSQVKLGGTVDPKYYMSVENVIDRSTFKRVVVGHRSSVKLEFNVSVPESTLRWIFVTERLDIGFSVLYKNASDGSEKTLIPFSRVNSHMVPEDGSILCSEPGIYVVKFDNSYSWLHNKRLWHNVDVTEPSTDLPPVSNTS